MNQATLEELNKEFLEKKKNNPAKITNFAKDVNVVAAKELTNIKNFPKTVKKESDNSYYKIFNKMGIPERYKKAKLSDFKFDDTKLHKYFRLLKKAIQMGRGLIVCGDYETGKTHFSFAFAKEVMKVFADEFKENSLIPKFVDFEEFLIDIRIKDNGETLKSYISSDLLIIDDFLKSDLESWELSRLTYIISKRYYAKKSIVLTANIKPEEIKKKCGGRLWQRMKKVNHCTEFIGENFEKARERFDSLEWDSL
jgi:DNA replication protein DnaC